jgi:hemolysin activation/secretion protein
MAPARPRLRGNRSHAERVEIDYTRSSLSTRWRRVASFTLRSPLSLKERISLNLLNNKLADPQYGEEKDFSSPNTRNRTSAVYSVASHE